MELHQTSITELTPNFYQPEARVSDKFTRGLKLSIEKNGLLSPILATKDGTVIDGHRRLKCCKELGINTVPVVFCSNENGRDSSLFRIANESTRKITESDYLGIYLKGGEVPARIVKRIAWVSDKLGRSFLKYLSKHGYSLSYPGRLYKPAMICGYSDRESFGKFVKWAIKYRMRSLCDSGAFHGSETFYNHLKRCVESNKKFNPLNYKK
jgi:hypothetical protein